MAPATPRELPDLSSARLTFDDEPIDTVASLLSRQSIDGGNDSKGEMSPGIAVSKEGPLLVVRPVPKAHPSTMCCAVVGTSKFCTAEKDVLSLCPVAKSHNDPKAKHVKLTPGLYLLNSAKTQAFMEPCFDIGLLGLRPLNFFSSLSGSKDTIIDHLEALERELKKGKIGSAREEIDRLKESKFLKTPAKFAAKAAFDYEFDPHAIVNSDLELSFPKFDHGHIFNGALKNFVDTTPDFLKSPMKDSSYSDTIFSKWFDDNKSTGDKVISVLTTIRDKLQEVAEISDTNATDVSLRVTSLESRVGDRPDEMQDLGNSMWSAFWELNTRNESTSAVYEEAITNLQEKLANLDKDVGRAYDFLGKSHKLVRKELDAMSSKISAFCDTTSSENPSSEHEVTTGRSLPDLASAFSHRKSRKSSSSKEMPVSYAELVKISETLADIHVRLDTISQRTDTIECMVSKGHTRIQIMGHTFSCTADLLCWLEKESPGVFSHGGFIDHYNVMKRHKNGDPTSASSATHDDTEDIKYQKNLQDMNLSMDEHIMEQTFDPKWPVPQLLAQGGRSKKTSVKSELDGMATYEDFHDKTLNKGICPTLKKSIENNRSNYYKIIEELYRDSPEIKHLAVEVLQKNMTFIEMWLKWVEDTYQSLTLGGQRKDDAWWIITKVTRSIFEDYIAPIRGYNKPTPADQRNLRAARYIWGCLQTYQAISDIIEKGFKNHPVVVGAYSHWLVQNSGRKEASDALTAVKSLKDQISTITTSVQKISKERSDTHRLAESAKKIADKAMDKASK